jgi:hypothetical protein
VPLLRGIDQVPAKPGTFKDKIEIHEDENGHYTGFTWTGTFTKAEEDSLVRWAQIPEFLYAVNDFVNIGPFEVELKALKVPPQEEIPVSIRSKLTVKKNSISWKGKIIASEEELKALNDTADMGGDVFKANMQDLIAGIFTAEAPLTAHPPNPIPANISAKLSIRRDGTERLVWKGSWSDEEIVSLDNWALSNDYAMHTNPPVGVPPLIRIAAAKLKDALLANKQWSSGKLRPDQGSLDSDSRFDNIRPQLSIEEDKILWRGHLRDVSAISELNLFSRESHSSDEAFRTAVGSIHAELERRRDSGLTFDFKTPVPKRPHTADLPEALRDRLLIGRAVASYHGIMDAEKTAGLLARDELQHVDGRALRRLYDKTVARGLRNSGLLIGARRGSAKPAEIEPIEILPLDDDDSGS